MAKKKSGWEEFQEKQNPKSKNEKELIKTCKENFEDIGGFCVWKKGQYYYGCALPLFYLNLDSEEYFWPRKSRTFIRIKMNDVWSWKELKGEDLAYKRFLLRKETLKQEEKSWKSKFASGKYKGLAGDYKPTEKTLKKMGEKIVKDLQKKK